MESTLNSRTALGIQGERGTTGSTIGAIRLYCYNVPRELWYGHFATRPGRQPSSSRQNACENNCQRLQLSYVKILLTTHNKEQSCAFPAPFIQNQARRYKRSRSWNQMTSAPLRTCKMPRSQVGLCGLGGLLCYICSCKKYTRASTTCT